MHQFYHGQSLFAKTTDGGHSWTSLKSNAFRVFYNANFRANSKGYVASTNGVYFKTTNGGATWDSLQTGKANFLYEIYFPENETLASNSSTSLVEVTNGRVFSKPYSARKVHYFSEQQCIGIGSHYEQGFYPYRDVFITNDNWVTHKQKTFPTSEAVAFMAIAKNEQSENHDPGSWICRNKSAGLQQVMISGFDREAKETGLFSCFGSPFVFAGKNFC
jgi:hypothetical protein